MYVYIERIWRWRSYKGWYAIKPNQPTNQQNLPIDTRFDLVQFYGVSTIVVFFNFKSIFVHIKKFFKKFNLAQVRSLNVKTISLLSNSSV